MGAVQARPWLESTRIESTFQKFNPVKEKRAFNLNMVTELTPLHLAGKMAEVRGAARRAIAGFNGRLREKLQDSPIAPAMVGRWSWAVQVDIRLTPRVESARVSTP